MFTASTAPRHLTVPSSLVDKILFSRPSAAVAARLPASLRALFFPVCLRSFWGRAVCVLLSARPALPGPLRAFPRPPWRLVALRAPRLSLRTCRLTPARFSALPRAPPAALLCFVRVLPLPALRRFACPSRRAAARRPLSSCLCFSPARRLRRRRTLPFVPVPLLPYRQPGPCLRLCPSCRLWRLFPCLRFPCLFLCLARRLWRPFSLPLFFSCPLWSGHSYGCFWDFFFFLLFLVRLSHGRGEGEGIE